MSMLTPPGMGGRYRIKGDRYPRMRPQRNRRKIAFAGLATALVLGLVGWGSLQLVGLFTGEGGTTAQAADDPGETCRNQDGEASGGKSDVEQADATGAPDGKPGGEAGASPTELPEPGRITVNVLNATPRSGLAAKTAEELEKRGFEIGEIANAPERLDHKVDATGLLIGATGAETLARMKVLGTHLEGAKTRHDERTGDAVDLVLGSDFAGLTDAKDAARAVQALASPSPEPSARC